ncbi:MAG: hypothetical protein QOE92_354, partial [Chloroflexota bacterium]|nr:hypothetical protein [Chloroflexota bacterium]
MVAYAGAASGLGTHVQGLVGAAMTDPGLDGWEVDVLLPEVDLGGDPVSWPAALQGDRVRVFTDGDASRGVGPSGFRDWIEAMLDAHPADVAYFPYPY